MWESKDNPEPVSSFSLPVGSWARTRVIMLAWQAPLPAEPSDSRPSYFDKSRKLRFSEVWTHYFESDTYGGCRTGSQSKASDPVCLAYTAPHKVRTETEKVSRGVQWEQPRDSRSSRLAPWPTPPLLQSLKSHKEGSVLAAHGQAGCPPPPHSLGLAATLGHSAPDRGQ